jgi:hypothetical protein
VTQYAGNDLFPTDFTIPDDSAPPTASNLLVSIEALGDRTVYLKNRSGEARRISHQVARIITSPHTTATINGNIAHSSSNAFLADANHWLLSTLNISAPQIAANPSNLFQVICRVEGTLAAQSGSQSDWGEIQIIDDFSGSAALFGASNRQIQVAGSGGANNSAPFSIGDESLWAISSPQSIKFALDLRCSAASGADVYVLGDVVTRIEVWAANPP